MAKPNQKLFNRKDLIAYLFVAGTGAIVQLISGSLLQDWFDISYAFSLPIAYQISLLVGFVLTKLFAFDVRNSEKTHREMVKFILVSQFAGVVMYITAFAALFFLNTLFPGFKTFIPYSNKDINVNQLISTIIGMGFSFFTNYYLHKTVTFKSTGFYDRLKVILK